MATDTHIPRIESAAEAGKGALAGLAGGAAAVGGGLEVAANAAGDVLRGIFGGLPWQMSSSEIVSAVTPGLLDVLGVVL